MTTRDRRLHDLKNELCIILGFAQMLTADAKPDDPRKSDLEEIKRAAKAALALFASVHEGRPDEPGDGWNEGQRPA